MARVIRSFQRYALQEYIEQVLKPVVGMIRFPQLHIHGTWKPTIADFRKRGGEYLMQAMYRAHLQRGFSDIAQHATIDPDGYIWAGRSLFTPPASATGFNDSDNDRVHPFMFEMIGNFDAGCEVLAGPQLATAAGLSRAVIDLFGAAPHLHREFTDQKTCPGSGIEKVWFLAQVAACGKEEDQPMTPAERKAFEDLQNQVTALTKLQEANEKKQNQPAPEWFKAEFKSADLGGIIKDPFGSEDFWRTIAVTLRAVKNGLLK